MALKRVKGTYDVLPSESYKWIALEEKIRSILSLYHLKEIRTPMMEYSNVFHRDSEGSDMVTKETYDFVDRKNRALTLRPEGTAGVIRSYVENKLYASNDVEKLYYIGPNFRYERPQKGRYRQFSQFGVEMVGALSASLDAEAIILAYDFIQRLGLKDVVVKINTLGDVESRKAYQKALETHFRPYQSELCSDCQTRIDKNPLRILDCKIDHNHPKVLDAPRPYDLLNDESKAYFDEVIGYLDHAGITYEIDHKLVRGLDYYSHTVFEIVANIKGFGAQNVLGGGGRYEALVKEMGGPDLGGIGFAFGMERLLIALDTLDVPFTTEQTLDCYVVTTSKALKKPATKLLYELRQAGIISDMNYQDKSFKAQFNQALRHNSKYIIILGDDEYEQGLCGLKDTQTEIQETVNLNEVKNILKKKLEQ